MPTRLEVEYMNAVIDIAHTLEKIHRVLERMSRAIDEVEPRRGDKDEHAQSG